MEEREATEMYPRSLTHIYIYIYIYIFIAYNTCVYIYMYIQGPSAGGPTPQFPGHFAGGPNPSTLPFVIHSIGIGVLLNMECILLPGLFLLFLFKRLNLGMLRSVLPVVHYVIRGNNNVSCIHGDVLWLD